MQSLDLNLASRPFKNNTLLWTGLAVSILLLSAFTAWSVQTYREESRYLDRMEDKLGQTASEFEQLDERDRAALAAIRRYDLDVLEVQAERANQAIEWEAFSWTRLFNRMAEVQPNGIKMLSIRPIFRAARGERRAAGDDAVRQPGVPVAVEGTARGIEAVFELQNALLASPHFGGVDPERLDRTERNEFLFKLSFYYLPDAEEGEEAGEADEVEEATEPEPGEDRADVARADGGSPADAGTEPGADADGLSKPAADADGRRQSPAQRDAPPAATEAEITQVEDAWEDAGAAGGEESVEPAAPAAGERPPRRNRPRAKAKRGEGTP